MTTALATLALQYAQETSAHDRLDGSMFWAGLFMVLTPLLLGLSVAGYIWWTRRRARAAREGNPPAA